MPVLIDTARKGLPGKSINNLANALGVSLKDVADLLLVSVRTLQRKETDELLKPHISAHVLQLADVISRAEVVLPTRSGHKFG